MKECRNNQSPSGRTPDLAMQLKIQAAEEDCSQKEIISTLLKGYLNGGPDDHPDVNLNGAQGTKNQTNK
jgi:hypothetical protein